MADARRAASVEGPTRRSPLAARRAAGPQLALFAPEPPPAPAPPHPVLEALRALDPNHLTPMQALELVARLTAEAQRS
jgi:DNA mismatch repair protein MutS